MSTPICRICLGETVMRTSHSANNNGRKYYRCKNTACNGFVGWCDDTFFHQTQIQFQIRHFEKSFIMDLLYEQNVGASQIRDFFAAKTGGKANLHYSKKDVNNHITSVKKDLVGVDVNIMLDFFRRKQQTDSEFFFAVERDEDNVGKNIFWVDGHSRRAYREFGDVIIFNTTYNTNKYRMPFAPFVGVNHRQ